MDILFFLITAAVIAVAGQKCTRVADRLADQTGMGEALMGGIFLGASTSISGTITSVMSAYHGHVDLSISNALGGIALQTLFLCIADIFYKKSNLEHASASSTNIMLGVLLILLLSLPIFAQGFDAHTYYSVHPFTIVLFLTYIGGLKYVQLQQNKKMWHPQLTEETVQDEAQEERVYGKVPRAWFTFITLSFILAIGGYFIEKLGLRLSKDWGISHLALGSLLTALATSLPELVVTLTAIKQNAITLAVGGIIGGNTYDVLFLAFSDIAYKDQSLYHVMNTRHFCLMAMNIAMMTVLLLGLIRREKHGPNNIGIETWVMMIIFLTGTLSVLN